MAALGSQNINQYQGVASNRVLHAVENAAARTGADFSYLMEKASVESSFNPTAKAKSSSATGLFQFIEKTWLHMVKEYGPKYGLGSLAEQIKTKDGQPCVEDCAARQKILNLRKNPEIAALMAGEFSAGNKHYLADHIQGEIGTTELYMAHFLGATGASKFLNSREDNGDAVAAKIFPREAHANKGVFFDQETGQARTLDQIYDFFADKFNSGTPTPLHSAHPQTMLAENGSISPAPAQNAIPLALAQALLSFNENGGQNILSLHDEASEKNENETARSGFSRARKISADNILLMAQAQANTPRFSLDRPVYNS